ncbi:HNH endonuclease family protein [Cryobacterium sp. TMB1-7]|uniref:HNH endonuclease family protein n=1 Tax=Cryobacterium sp. TMB1-7 TaxID=2555866 RepID=UPI00106A0763|nr:HNH endonuclease family protein [Cryobacterium sp. TMB1-7]TFC59247.1 HNH endonuclease [Cryobacterium sp. TMB1-7]
MSRRRPNPSLFPRRRGTRGQSPRLLLILLVIGGIVAGVSYFSTDLADRPTTQATVPPGASSTAPMPVPPSGLTSAEALVLVAALPDAVYTDNGSYAGNREELFGDAWAFDFDQNGCDTRNDILTRDLTGTDIDPATCRVYTGILTDPYTGETIDFVRGQDTSADVQIDHLLPLKAVYATGGEAWPAEKREALANDPVNLLAVKGTENSSKSDSLPSEWLPGFYPDVSDRHDLGQRVVWDDLPEDTGLQCWYIDKLVPVFVAYDLGLTPEDRAAMTAVLSTCDA